MAALTIEHARAHCRLDSDYPEDQLLPYMAAAESYVAAHLNRTVYPDQIALDAAQDALGAALGAAYVAYEAALFDAEQVDNPAQKQTMIEVAEARYCAAKADARRTMNGIVINGTIEAAMLLTLGNLFANRETDVVGASVAALPMGVPELLRPFRLVQMP